VVKENSVEITVDEFVKTCLKKNLNFAAFRLPNTDKKELVIQKDEKLNFLSDNETDFDFQGFLVSPFTADKTKKAFIIRPDIYIRHSSDTKTLDKICSFKSLDIISNEKHLPEEISHKEYLDQLKIITDNISTGHFEKVVLSRVKIIEGNYVDKLSDIFSKLCDDYENAFVYLFNAGPDLWMGATPEPLLKARNGKMHTVSLAGTRPLSKVNLNIGSWNSKERLEQEYVTRYITKVLSKFNLLNVELEGPYTKRAGNLVHLRTDFSFRSVELENKLRNFLGELHPTPAVCGMPRKESLDLIFNLEKHNREFYAGYLGPVGLNNQLNLFVNLRCMKVLPNQLALFIGGGITADSVPEDEWQETEIKAETLLSVIRRIRP
jgi:isochorismate synthase